MPGTLIMLWSYHYKLHWDPLPPYSLTTHILNLARELQLTWNYANAGICYCMLLGCREHHFKQKILELCISCNTRSQNKKIRISASSVFSSLDREHVPLLLDESIVAVLCFLCFTHFTCSPKWLGRKEKKRKWMKRVKWKTDFRRPSFIMSVNSEWQSMKQKTLEQKQCTVILLFFTLKKN